MLVEVEDMPVHDRRVNAAVLSLYLDTFQPDHVVIEHTQAMPKNGSIASFSLGLNTGIVMGVVGAKGIPMTRVRPQAWKKSNRILGKRGKDAARALATDLWPDQAPRFKRVRDSGRADAVLIARSFMVESGRDNR